MLRVQNLTVERDKKRVLHNISFDLKEKSITSVIGPNGSGKSTLLKSISRYLGYKGEILLQGRDIQKYRTRKLAEKMAYLPQRAAAPSDYTVRDLVCLGRFPLKGRRATLNSRDTERIQWALERTELTEYSCRAIGTLSGGEQQRAWIAMALAREPDLLLLDEPTTFLDIAHQLEILELIKEINNQTGTTVMMVLHDINQAARYSEEILVLKEGQLHKQGEPQMIISSETMEEVFSLKGDFLPGGATPCFIPQKSSKQRENNLKKSYSGGVITDL